MGTAVGRPRRTTGPGRGQRAGFTLYRFDEDTADPSKSNCSGQCATTWPPYLVARGGTVFLDGIDKSAIGRIERDGAPQVTIGGWPVYLFNKDTRTGDTNGQGVGGTWFGVTPDGEKASGGQPGGDAHQSGADAGADVDPEASPAGSATFFQGANFADPSQGVAGPGCRNVRFSGSIQVSGAIKLWDGPNCTGNVKVVSGNVQDLSAIGFATVKSVRFLGRHAQRQTLGPPAPNPRGKRRRHAPSHLLSASTDFRIPRPAQGTCALPDPERVHPSHLHAPPQLPRRRKSMSRSDVLVDADWVQENLDN
ncbi:hypothetical protein ACWEPT_39215, partial [Streptomyces chartreusis]